MNRANPLQRHEPVSEINVTPMVDVMLVLLVIFMVAAPMLQQGIEVNLPKAATGTTLPHEAAPVITLTKEGNIYFNDNVVTVKSLRQKLSVLKNGQMVLIRADRHAEVNKLIQLWDLCREAGFAQVRITTLPE